MTITRDTRIEYLYTVVRFLSDYANLSDDSDFFRGISQIAPEEISISSEERKNSSEVSNETSEEANHKSEEFRHFLGRKTKISPEIFENSSEEIEMSSLSLYCNASALAPRLGFARCLLLFSNFEAWYIPR